MRNRRRKQDDDATKEGVPLAYIKRNLHLLVLLAAVLLTVAVMWAAISSSYNPINNESNSLFPDPWQYRVDDGAFAMVTLPKSETSAAGARIELKNNLPLVLIKGATVLLRTSQQDAEVFVSGECIYSTYHGVTGNPMPSSAYHFVRLPVDCAGEEIRIVLSSPFANYAGFMNQIHIGSKASNLFFLLKENGLRLVVGFLVLCTGLLLMIMFSFTKEHGSRSALIFLGAFFFCAGYWVVVESKLAQLIIPHPVLLTNSSIFALTLLPVFSGLYYFKTHASVGKRVGTWVIVAVSGASLLLAVAACFDPTFPLRALPHYLAFMGVYIVLMSAAVVLDAVKQGRICSTPVFGILAFAVCAFLELAFYLSNLSHYNQSTLLTIGLLLFCVAMVADSVQNFAKVSRMAIKADALSVLAYTDSLTGLQNRAAFLEAISAVDPGAFHGVTLGMFDLNHLKEVNDSFGHLVGDAMLRHSAKVIVASLRAEDRVYRIGGDEFVAIIIHDGEMSFDRLADRVIGEMRRENQKTLNYRLSIAYGYATFDDTTDRTLFETLSRADERMYVCKRKQKAQE